MSTEAPVHYNKVVPNNVRDSKKNIITLHSKILTLTDTFTIIHAFLYKSTFSLGMPTMVNRSPYIQTKAISHGVQQLICLRLEFNIRNVLIAHNTPQILIPHLRQQFYTILQKLMLLCNTYCKFYHINNTFHGVLFKYKRFMCRNKICHHKELILHNRTLQGYSSCAVQSSL